MHKLKNESDFDVDKGFFAVKFEATWCMPCKSYTPIINKLDDEFDDVSFITVDIDVVPELAQRFKVKTLPTLILIKDGDEVDRILGKSKITPVRSKLKKLSNV